MKTIKIIVPENPKNDKWKVGGKHRANVNTTFSYVERQIIALLKAGKGEKIHLIVNYDLTHGLRLKNPPEWWNDTISASKKELLYRLASFLEDYLSPDKFKQLTGKYLMKSEDLKLEKQKNIETQIDDVVEKKHHKHEY